MLRTIQALLATGVLAAAASAGAAVANTAADAQCPTYTKASKGLPTSAEWRTYPVVGDWNGDGLLDLAATPRKDRGPRAWLATESNGSTSWKESSRGLALPGVSCGVGMATADLNGDGHLDLGVADHCYGLFVYFGDGKGNWRPGPQAQINRGDPGLEDLAFGDVEGDGDIDVATIGAISGGMALFLNDGTGRFTRAQSNLPTRGAGRNITFGDLNGDGLLDLAASYSGLGNEPTTDPIAFNLLWIASRKPEGGLHFETLRETVPVDVQSRYVTLEDLDSDGDLDIVALFLPFTRTSPILRAFRGDGSGNFSEIADAAILFSTESRVQFSATDVADLNGDGTLDLVAVQSNEDRFHTWLGTPSGAWLPCGSASVGISEGEEWMRSIGLEVADMNRDGKPDLVMSFGRIGKGSIEVWLAN